MSNKQLKLNMSLTRALIYHPKPAVPTPFPLSAGGNSIYPFTQAKQRTVILDCFLRLTLHIQPIGTAFWFNFQNVTRIWSCHHLSCYPLAQVTTISFSTALLTLLPSLCCGLFKYSDEGAITTTKSDQVSHVLRTHRWLPISHREKPKTLQWPMRLL